MDYVKVGLLMAKLGGELAHVPGSSILLDIVGELIKSNDEVMSGIQRIESIAKGQVLGLMNVGRIALFNTTSEYISMEKKLAEIERAKNLFEECYGIIHEIPQFSKFKGDVAFQIACCNAMLGIKDLQIYWLSVAEYQFKDFVANFDGDKDTYSRRTAEQQALSKANAIKALIKELRSL